MTTLEPLHSPKKLSLNQQAMNLVFFCSGKQDNSNLIEGIGYKKVY